MRYHAKKQLSHHKDWEGFKITGNRLVLPDGERVTPQQLITGLALIEINTDLEIEIKRKLLKYARIISKGYITQKNIKVS
ncbi:hypothetical protein TUMSATVNIG2_16520 [Vibrio nigripulchritudo]|nr:hypothetical protein TUMSATVNIG2_16520 [Vibrio nigripulchritudo]